MGMCFLVFIFRLYLKNFLSDSGDTLTALVNNVWIGTGNTLWGLAAQRLTDWETLPTPSTSLASFILKSSFFRIVNTYASLVYISFAIKNSVYFAGQSDRCAVRISGVLATDAQVALFDQGLLPGGAVDCIGELYEQLYIQMSVNWLFCFLFVHLLNPTLRIVRRFLRKVPGKDALDDATFQRARASVEEGADNVLEGGKNLCNPVDLWLRVLHEDDLGFLNITEMYLIILLQFGYIALFSVAFPIAGVVGIVSNIISFRTDLWAILRNSTRPLPQGAQDTGAWLGLFYLIAGLALISNCSIITVTTVQPLFTVQFKGYTVSDMKCVLVLFFCVSLFSHSLFTQ